MRRPRWSLFALLAALHCCPRATASTDYRLPTDIEPVSYDVTVNPDFKTFQFGAEAVIRFRAANTTDRLVLNAKDLTVDYDGVEVKGPEGYAVPVEGVTTDRELERLTVTPKTPFLRGREYVISFSYAGSVNTEGVGLYRNSYTDDAGKIHWFLVTQLRPVHARRVFPCLDEPAFRAHFVLSVWHDPDRHVISNMPVFSAITSKGNKTLTTFQGTPKIPAFLVGFMVSDLASVQNGAWGGYAVPGRVEGARYGAGVAPSLALAMQRHLDIPYPQAKTDIVALPFLGPVAMENWGLFNFREQFMLYYPLESKTIQKQTSARFISHEIAHAWMGNPVTIAWWDYLWLSEVFAMYYEYYIPSLVEPSWAMRDQLVVDLHQTGLLDDSVPTEPLTTTVLTPQQISAKFSGVTYSKGPALLRMIIHVLGEGAFVEGFREFLTKNAYSSVTPEDLWNELELRGNFPTPLTEIMNNWTHLSGYPEVRVTRDYGTGLVKISQSTFKLNSSDLGDGQTWWIPLSYTTARQCDFNTTTPQVWFKPQSVLHLHMLPTTPDDWLIFNIQSTAFYRTNYDPLNWKALIGQLNKDPTKIHELNRAQLVDDALNLARGGRLEWGTALEVSGYLRYELAFMPWNSALKAFDFLDMVLFHTPLHHMFKDYMLTLLYGVYDVTGFAEKPGEVHLTKLTRELITRWSCEMGNPDCVAKSRAYLASLSPKSKAVMRISVDVRDTALCTGVAEGGQKEWQIILSLYANSKPDFRQRYLTALACTTDINNIHRFLIDSLNELTEANWNTRFVAFAARKNNAERLLQLIFNHRDAIVKRFGVENYTKYLTTLSRVLSTENHLIILSDLENTGISLGNARSRVYERVAWLETHLRPLEVYLQHVTRSSLVFN